MDLDAANAEWLIQHRLQKAGLNDPLAFAKKQDELWSRECPKRDVKLESTDGWMLPNGDFYPCGYMEHIWLATKILEDKLKVDLDGQNAEKIAEDRGWVKIAHGLDGRLHIQNHKKHTQKQLDRLFDWCEKHSVDYKKYVRED